MRLYEAAQDKGLMKELQEYFIATLEKEAVRKVFEKEDIAGVAEAKNVVDKAFESIDAEFQPKMETKQPINEAR